MMTSDQNHPKDMTVVLAYLSDMVNAAMYAAQADQLEGVLQRIAEISRELVNARYAALGVPDGMGGLRYFEFTGIPRDHIAKIGHLPRGRGLLGAIMRERLPIRLAEMRTDARSVGFPPHHPPMTSLLGVPIQVGDQLFGTLYLCDRIDGQPFNDQDQWLIETMAGYAALAIAGTMLSEQKERLALLEERERIGMELHDGIIQSLYAIGMHLDLLRGTGNNVATAELSPSIDALNDVIEDIRRYILDLKIKNYRQRTVNQCFMDIVHRLHIPESIQVFVEAPDDLPPFTPATFESVCQIVYEAVSNSVRHASANTIRVVASQDQRHFEVAVVDDGKGFELEILSMHGGLGLRNIKQRARMHGGTVDIDTKVNRGTRLRLTIPLMY